MKTDKAEKGEGGPKLISFRLTEKLTAAVLEEWKVEQAESLCPPFSYTALCSQLLAEAIEARRGRRRLEHPPVDRSSPWDRRGE